MIKAWSSPILPYQPLSHTWQHETPSSHYTHTCGSCQVVHHLLTLGHASIERQARSRCCQPFFKVRQHNRLPIAGTPDDHIQARGVGLLSPIRSIFANTCHVTVIATWPLSLRFKHVITSQTPITVSTLLRVSALHYPTIYRKGSEGFGHRLQLVRCANLLLSPSIQISEWSAGSYSELKHSLNYI